MTEALHGYPTEGVVVDEIKATHLFLENIPSLIRRARRARGDAASYRVQVGVAGFGVNPYTGRQITREGGNIKPAKSKETICAERNVANAIGKIDGAAKIIGLVVIGPMDEEIIASINADIVTDTLHPCWRCRVELPRMPSITNETLIMTGGGGVQGESATTNLYQIHTMGQMLNLYNQPGNVADNQDAPLVNVPFGASPVLFDNKIIKNRFNEPFKPALTAIEALHDLSS